MKSKKSNISDNMSYMKKSKLQKILEYNSSSATDGEDDDKSFE